MKEIDQRNKTLETSQITSDKKKNTRARHWKNNDSNNRNYPNKGFKFKNKAYNNFKENAKSVMNKDKQTLFTLQKEIVKAVLLDKYITNKGYAVVKNESGIFKYQISISNKFPAKRYYVRYEGEWIRMKYKIHELKSKWLILGRNNIINTLRERKKENKKHGKYISEKSSNKNQHKTQDAEMEEQRSESNQ